MDSTPLDLFVQMPDGSISRPELTYAIDVATSSIGATLLHAKAAKSVDLGALLLSRMLCRVTDQPWWPDAVALAERLFERGNGPIRPALEEAAARAPLIVPESVTIDRGKVYVGSTFVAACERLEISQRRANPRQATDKPHVEGGFKRIRDGFVQYLAGYSGGNILNRAEHPQSEAVWTLEEAQLLLNLWVITHWQTTPQSGLRIPGMPLRKLSPNQKYAALSGTAPHVPVHLTRDEYIALLPLEWRTVQPYGVNFRGLIYDADELHPLRGRKSGRGGEAGGRWEVRYDPYNLRQIWIRDDARDRWITAAWVLATQAEHPFSIEVLRAAQQAIAGSGESVSSIDVLAQINRIQTGRIAAANQELHPRRGSGSKKRESTAVGLRLVTPDGDGIPTMRSQRPVVLPRTSLDLAD